MQRVSRFMIAGTAMCAAAMIAATPAQAGGAGGPYQADDPYSADVVVAQASAGKQAHFPDIAKLADGRLLATYREGAGHIGQDGRLLLVHSSDGGSTWSSPRVVVDTPADDRDPKLAVLRDGTVILSYFVIDWKPAPPHTVLGTYVTRSTDGGNMWSAPVKVATHLDGASERVGGSYRLGWAASHGAVSELSNGDLLAPLYGTLPDDPRERATVVRSTDGGLTWDIESEATLAVADGISFQEPVLTVLPNGQVVVLIRSNSAGFAYLARSYDGGYTWTPAERTDMPASSHHLLTLANGDILVTYGDLSNRFSTYRETVGRLITKPERSWDGHKDILLYDSRTGDQANPSSLEVRPGVYLTLSFDVRTRAVVGVFSTAADYRLDPPLPGYQLDLGALYRDGELTVETDMVWTNSAYPTIGPLGAIDGSIDYWHASTPGRNAPAASHYTVTFSKAQIVTGVGVALKPGYRESASIFVSSDGLQWREVARYNLAVIPELAWVGVTGDHHVKAVKVVVDNSDGNWAQLTELAIRTAGPTS